MIQTERLCLIPANAETTRAEMDDLGKLARLLKARIPSGWPPEMLADALPWFLDQFLADPGITGWLGWYAVTSETLIGSGGFMGRPVEGEVEIGYSLLPEFHRQGFGSEMVRGLLQWAFRQESVDRVIAHVSPSNEASIRLLKSAGFCETDVLIEGKGKRFVLARAS